MASLDCERVKSDEKRLGDEKKGRLFTKQTRVSGPSERAPTRFVFTSQAKHQHRRE
jgi:hypothetical protein